MDNLRKSLANTCILRGIVGLLHVDYFGWIRTTTGGHSAIWGPV